jgi:hypothetical protein
VHHSTFRDLMLPSGQSLPRACFLPLVVGNDIIGAIGVGGAQTLNGVPGGERAGRAIQHTTLPQLLAASTMACSR